MQIESAKCLRNITFLGPVWVEDPWMQTLRQNLHASALLKRWHQENLVSGKVIREENRGREKFGKVETWGKTTA